MEHGRYLTAMATVGNDSHRFVAVGSTSGRVAIYDIRSEATQRRTVIKYCNEAAVTGKMLISTLSGCAALSQIIFTVGS